MTKTINTYLFHHFLKICHFSLLSVILRMRSGKGEAGCQDWNWEAEARRHLCQRSGQRSCKNVSEPIGIILVIFSNCILFWTTVQSSALSTVKQDYYCIYPPFFDNEVNARQLQQQPGLHLEGKRFLRTPWQIQIDTSFFIPDPPLLLVIGCQSEQNPH